MIKMLTVLILSLLMFTPAPVVLSGDPFIFDPSQCPSSPMLAVVIPVGVEYSGQLEVYEPDGEPVTIVADKVTVNSVPITVSDANDPLGLAVTHTFTWSWSPTVVDIGLHYINVNVADPLGASDDRTLVLLIKVNQPPVIVGCR